MAQFAVIDRYVKDGKTDIKIPTRATENSAGYDLYAADDILVRSYSHIMEDYKSYVADKIPYSLDDLKTISKGTGLQPTLVPTGVAIQLEPDEYFSISVRSSLPLNDWVIVANAPGVVDADYYPNEIGVELINLSPADIIIHKGDKIAQGVILKYNKIDGDNTTTKRTGGFGSTGGAQA